MLAISGSDISSRLVDVRWPAVLDNHARASETPSFSAARRCCLIGPCASCPPTAASPCTDHVRRPSFVLHRARWKNELSLVLVLGWPRGRVAGPRCAVCGVPPDSPPAVRSHARRRSSSRAVVASICDRSSPSSRGGAEGLVYGLCRYRAIILGATGRVSRTRQSWRARRVGRGVRG